jgi:CO dehydrogenase/acetyl-CoA synthase beta subunit
MSDTLYRKLVIIKPEIPQIIKFASITKYLDEKTVFDYGVLMAEDLLGTDISYYTVIPEDLFTEIFEERVVPKGTSIADFLPEKGMPSAAVTGAADEEIQSEPMQVFTGQYIEKITGLDTQAKIQTYLVKLYPKLISNLPLQDKINYIESYSELATAKVIFLRLAGEERNSGFEVDIIQAALQLQELTAN